MRRGDKAILAPLVKIGTVAIEIDLHLTKDKAPAVFLDDEELSELFDVYRLFT